MSPRRDLDRLRDIAAAIRAIRRHLARGTVEDELIFDACRVRLIEIGEAVKALGPEVRELSAETPWSEIAKMRDRLAHRYFDTQLQVVAETVTDQLEPLDLAVRRIYDRLAQEETGQTALDIDAAD